MTDLNELKVSGTYNYKTLGSLYQILFPFIIDAPRDNKNYWQAEELFFKTLYDRDSKNRRGLELMMADALEHGATLAEFVSRYTDTAPADLRLDTPRLALDFVEHELQYAEIPAVAVTVDEAYELLQPYFNSLEKHLPENELVGNNTIWEVFTSGYKPFTEVFWRWLNTVDQKKLLPYSLVETYKISLNLKAQIDLNTYEAFTQSEYEECYQYLDAKSPIVAAVAAERLAAAYYDEHCLELPVWQYPLATLLNDLMNRQKKGACIIGGFLHGLLVDQWLTELERRPDLINADFDVKAWVLDVALGSSENEPYIYPTQAFWFYVHEYLDRDAVSVQKLLVGKRYWLALMCATESLDYSFKDMKPILVRLVSEAPPAIATAATNAIDRFDVQNNGL